MKPGILSGVGSALAWFALPLIPALLGVAYHQQLNWDFGSAPGPDPRDWGMAEMGRHDRPPPRLRLPGRVDARPSRRAWRSRGEGLAFEAVALDGGWSPGSGSLAGPLSSRRSGS